MAKKPTQIFQMRVGPDFTRALEQLAAMQEDSPTKSQMVRRLVKYAFSKKLMLRENVIEKSE